MSQAPLPPGSTGLPLIGETPAFLADGFAFIQERFERLGPVFRTRILGSDTAVIVGADASAAWIDLANVRRAGSVPGFLFNLFAGPSLPHLDDEEHRRRKTWVLAGFGPEALAAYLPGMVEVVRAALARWKGAGTLPLVPELKRVAMEAICGNVLGLAPGPELEATVRDYGLVTQGAAGIPLNLPGTAYRAGLKAKDRILVRLAAAIRDHEAEPRPDGIGRIRACALADGSRIGADALMRELHHIVLAGFIIFAEFARMVLELSRRPELRAELAAEAGAIPAGSLTLEALDGLPRLTRFVMETKRLTPQLPAIFGVARRTFEFKGHRIPEGWWLLWAWHSTMKDPAVYADPERFDPDRFAPPRSEHEKHPHGFAPQGPGPELGHRCPGTAYATVFMKVFAVELLRAGLVPTLPAQDLDYDFGRVPPEPRGGLLTRFGPA